MASTRREEDSMSFKWSASGGIEALSVLAGVRFDLMFTELDAIVNAYRSAHGRGIRMRATGSNTNPVRPRGGGPVSHVLDEAGLALM